MISNNNILEQSSSIFLQLVQPEDPFPQIQTSREKNFKRLSFFYKFSFLKFVNPQELSLFFGTRLTERKIKLKRASAVASHLGARLKLLFSIRPCFMQLVQSFRNVKGRYLQFISKFRISHTHTHT